MEGETALLLASLAASQGLIDLFWVIVVGLCRCHDRRPDQLSGVPPVRAGAWWRATKPCNARTEKARRLLAGHPIKFIILSRFFWGLRSACMLALAASDVPTRVFAPFNLVACALWATVIGLAGLRVQRLGQPDRVHHGRPVGTRTGHRGRYRRVSCCVLGRRAVLRFWRSRNPLRSNGAI